MAIVSFLNGPILLLDSLGLPTTSANSYIEWLLTFTNAILYGFIILVIYRLVRARLFADRSALNR